MTEFIFILRKEKTQKKQLQLKLLIELGYPDSNQEKQDQNLLCYHYTIAQTIIRIPSVRISVSFFVVGLPGLEPGKTGPESVVLPLHHSPKTY